ncbi:hypothetical protein BGZ76_003120, partial [Entomortierella beljakovae]
MDSREEMLEQLAGSIPRNGGAEYIGANGLLDREVDIDSLDISIATPTANVNMEPFSSREIPANRSQHGSSLSEQLHYFARSRGHAKTFSQQSCATIKGGYTEDISTYAHESLGSSSSSRQLQPQPQSLNEETSEDVAEDMLFASPYYRKSVALSDHSDLALDPSSPSGRGLSTYISDTGPQYTNLLRDATMIIEQQHLQDNIQPGSAGDDADVGDVDQIKYNNLDTETDTSLQHHYSTGYSNTQISEAGSDVGGGPLSSTKSTLTRSRSRRFSAPGHPGSSHNSLASQSVGSGLSRTESTTTQDTVAYIAPPASVSRGPQSFPVDGEPIIIDYRNSFLAGHSSQSSFANGGEESEERRYPIHPLQHHATMQPCVSSEHESDTPNLTVVTTSSNSQHQPRLHHDYRPGVAFEYYEGEWDWLPNFDEMRPDNAGIVGNFMIDDTTEQDLFRPRFSSPNRSQSGKQRQFKETGNFAVRFTTYIDITQDGVYSFWLSSNDGSVLYVSNTLVVENDGMHYTTEVEGRIMLQAGKHAMTVEFFHKNGKMLEGFRSTGPSLIVSYRAPGPIWSFGLKSGPKRIIKSNNLFYDHGDIRLRNLLREFGVDDDGSSDNNEVMSPNRIVSNGPGVDYWPPSVRNPQNTTRPSRHKAMSGDMSHAQPSARELNVQMENAKTTIRDLEQIIRDQAESHKRKMSELYGMLQESQGQIDRMVSGMKRTNLFETPRTTVTPTFNHVNQQPSGWRNTVMSVYVDAEEDYPLESHHENNHDNSNENETPPVSDDVLAKHLADVEKLKQLYFFSMALSVKMNCEMMGKKPPEYTTTSVQKLYEECAIISKVPVEGWPGYVSRYF